VDGGSVSPSRLGAIYERARFCALNSSKSKRAGRLLDAGGAVAARVATGRCRLEAVAPPSFIPRLASAVARRAQEASRLFLFLFYLERRVCQRAALQARFRSRISRGAVVLTVPAESTLMSMR
jgi:hypothetical protein